MIGEKYYIWVRQKFCNILVVREVQFGSFGWFCWGREGDEPYWTFAWYSLGATHTVFDPPPMTWSTALESTVLGLPDLA